jgi:site-specific DNA-cytosine methylase
MTTLIKVADMFAGLGGLTKGALLAGLSVVWAANHWPSAVHWHSENHPQTVHACQDLRQTDWRSVPKYDWLTGSSCCQGHFPNNRLLQSYDDSRATAWAFIEALEHSRARVCIIENIPEFLNWELYPAFKDAAWRLGYAISENVLDAADLEVPQHRRRLFLILTRSKAPLVLNLEKRPHVAVRNCLDLEAYPWSPVLRPGRSNNTIERVRAGYRDQGELFVMPYYSSGSGKTGRSIDRPLGTVTTRDRWAVVRGDFMRMVQPLELVRVMSFPGDYKIPKNKKLAVHLMGNAVPPVMAQRVFEEVARIA